MSHTIINLSRTKCVCTFSVLCENLFKWISNQISITSPLKVFQRVVLNDHFIWTTLPMSLCYNNITTGTFWPITARPRLLSNWRVVFRSRRKTRAFFHVVTSTRFSVAFSIMSDPSKQDIAAIFKRLRSIPTNKVRIFKRQADAFVNKEVVQTPDTSHLDKAKLSFDLREDFFQSTS